MGLAVRAATLDDHGSAMFLLDGAMLDADAEAVRRRIDAGSVFVAVAGGDPDGRVVGVCVLDGREIEQIAVRRERRGRGVGTALVEAVDSRVDGELTAEFRESVRPFYDSLGFEVREAETEGRFRGVLR
ncbi:Acetyltransferase (GNAT) domain-containing protein [Halopelagius inordinatus]|uniref:Acetyltransferase (GNAT) domain-containing protein n=1 Tax=Halopelagius inordinatus TaxID=553467 RepID=A0A1I2LKI7_9EURY|nr:GNAT family N-acetyltransferase [Halopelagius inordinatus]SFF79785.1 Acetyltransferase (GNAT) domain-containing protein [Halopelagius inordinatus]